MWGYKLVKYYSQSWDVAGTTLQVGGSYRCAFGNVSHCRHCRLLCLLRKWASRTRSLSLSVLLLSWPALTLSVSIARSVNNYFPKLRSLKYCDLLRKKIDKAADHIPPPQLSPGETECEFFSQHCLVLPPLLSPTLATSIARVLRKLVPKMFTELRTFASLVCRFWSFAASFLCDETKPLLVPHSKQNITAEDEINLNSSSLSLVLRIRCCNFWAATTACFNHSPEEM